MRDDHRTPSPEVLAVKVPADLAHAIKRRAREDDRTVSAYVRRVLTAAMEEDTSQAGTPEEGHGR